MSLRVSELVGVCAVVSLWVSELMSLRVSEFVN